MNILKLIAMAALILLGAASGVAKITQMPQELKFFGDAGFDPFHVLIFGVVQFAAALLIAIPKTRRVGATLLGVTFCFSTILIFWAGNVGFGLFSILPILVAGYFAFEGRG